MGSVHYICICNRLSEERIAEAVAKGARTPSEVLRLLRLRRGCSGCSVEVGDVIDRALAAHRLAAE